MDDLHLSADARRRLEEELEWRSGERRREISAWIERAREHGDIRENADYDAAKNDQGHNEARVRQLEDMLRRAVQVESVAGDVVEPGTVVEVRIEGGELGGAFVGQASGHFRVPPREHPVLPGRSRLSAVEPPRRAEAPLGDERPRGGLEHLELALDTVAAGVRAGAAATSPQPVAVHANRERPLERFDGRVARVRHRG